MYRFRVNMKYQHRKILLSVTENYRKRHYRPGNRFARVVQVNKFIGVVEAVEKVIGVAEYKYCITVFSSILQRFEIKDDTETKDRVEGWGRIKK